MPGGGGGFEVNLLPFRGVRALSFMDPYPTPSILYPTPSILYIAHVLNSARCGVQVLTDEWSVQICHYSHESEGRRDFVAYPHVWVHVDIVSKKTLFR